MGAEQWIGAGFTLANVPEGDYRVTVTARPLGVYSEGYDALVIEDVHVVAGETFELGDLDLGATVEWDDSYSEPVSGSEPSLQLVTSALQVGGMLHADPGTWTGSPTGFDYRWLRNGHAIPGAAGEDYLLAPGDAGASISVRVSPLIGDSYLQPVPRDPGEHRGYRCPRRRCVPDRCAHRDGHVAGRSGADRLEGQLESARPDVRVPVAARRHADRSGDGGYLQAGRPGCRSRPLGARHRHPGPASSRRRTTSRYRRSSRPPR